MQVYVHIRRMPRIVRCRLRLIAKSIIVRKRGFCDYTVSGNRRVRGMAGTVL